MIPPAALSELPPTRPNRLLGLVIDVLPWIAALAFAAGLLAGG